MRTKLTKNPDRVPPFSLEAEQGVIGCILLDFDACFSKARDAIHDPSTFYDLRTRVLWEACLEVGKDKRVDAVTLTQQLKDTNLMQDAGGPQFMSECTNIVPTALHIDDYIQVLREKFTLRRIITDCTDLIGGAFENEPVSKVLDRFVSVASNHLSGRDHTGIRHATAREAVAMAIEQAEWRFNHPKEMSGIPTGYSSFDRWTDGLQRGELILFCARPSQGKSAALLNLVDNVCLKNGIPTLFFSLEMSIRAMTGRLMCGHQRIDSMRMRKGELAQDEMSKISKFSSLMNRSKLFFAESSAMGIHQLMRVARELKRKHDIKLIAVDYLQIVKPSEKNEKRTYEVATVSSGLKELAKELDIPVVVACQLNRESEKEKGRRPKLVDIGDSGQIERDADLAVMIYHHPEQHSEEVSECEWIIAKQREGPTMSLPMVFLRKFTRFEERTDRDPQN